MVTVFGNSNATATVQVYNVPGVGSAAQAMSQIAQTIRQNGADFGTNIQYQQSGSSGGFTVFSGTTSGNYGSVGWVGAFKSTGNGYAGITIGANEGVNIESTARNILNTLQ